jgi:hypothetical protein
VICGCRIISIASLLGATGIHLRTTRILGQQTIYIQDI